VAGNYIYLADYGTGFWMFSFSLDTSAPGLRIETTKISYPNPFNPECYIPLNAKCKVQNVKCKM
jgi:hypothetical protein